MILNKEYYDDYQPHHTTNDFWNITTKEENTMKDKKPKKKNKY